MNRNRFSGAAGSQGVVFHPPRTSATIQFLGVIGIISLVVSVGLILGVGLAQGHVGWPLLMLIAVLQLLPLATVAVPARGIRYRVGRDDGITVHHLGETLYRWEALEAVEVLQRRLRSFHRTGFGGNLPGYYVGRFRESELGHVRVNATVVVPPLVLLKTQPMPVIMSPEDVDGFVAAVERYQGHSETPIVEPRR